MSLKTLQEQLFEAITLQSNEDKALEWVKSDELMSAKGRLGVYQFAYRERLKECIEEDYPDSVTHLGEEEFDSLFVNFANTKLSHHWNINGFNALWNQYIQENSHDNLIKEMTHWEWLKVESFFKHNRQESPLFPEIILSEEHKAKVRLDDSVLISSFNYDFNDDHFCSAIGSKHLIWTRKFTSRSMILSEVQDYMTQSMMKHSHLDEIISDMAQHDFDDSLLADAFQTTISLYLEKGILVQV